MKVCIPDVGDAVVLAADWTFQLYDEHRNETLMEHMKDTRRTHGYPMTVIPCTIPAGATLKIDRVYIRKGNSEFSSLSFMWVGMSTNPRMDENQSWDYATNSYKPAGTFRKVPRRPIRFWAKLEDVNTMEITE